MCWESVEAEWLAKNTGTGEKKKTLKIQFSVGIYTLTWESCKWSQHCRFLEEKKLQKELKDKENGK